MKYLFLFLILFFTFQHKAWSEQILTEFLIAKPDMPDPRFKETVIVMLYHNSKEGAAGLVINKPMKTITFDNLFSYNNLIPPENITKKEINLYWGGPVKSEHIFFIHTSDYKSDNFITSNKDFAVSGANKILLDIAKNNGPKEYIALLGIATWNPGQLDSEIKEGSWRKISSSYSLIFYNDSKKWNRLLNSKDI